MLGDDLRRRPVYPGRLAPDAAPRLVGTPRPARQPGKAGLDQHDLQGRMLREHALRDQAEELVLESGRLRDIVLAEVARPAVRRRRLAIAAGRQLGSECGWESVCL